MKITTKLYLNAVASVILVLAVLVGLFFNSSEMAARSRTHEVTRIIQEAVFDLNILTYEYFMHGETRMEVQWIAEYAAIETLFSPKNFIHEKDQRQLNAIGSNFKSMRRLFTQLAQNRKKRDHLRQRNETQKNPDVTLQQEERLVARLLITAQTIFTQTSVLSEKSYQEGLKAQRSSSYASLILMVVLAIIVTITSLSVVKNFSGRLKKLTDGAEETTHGNLNFQIDLHSKDELGHLAAVFNKMLRALLEFRTGLEDKVAERTKQLEASNVQLKKSNLELDDFAYIASHDLKEPLRGISNYATFIREDYEDKLDEDGKQMLLRMSNLTRRMQQLVDDLLEYSRLGRTELATGNTDTHIIAKSIRDELGDSLEEFGIACEIKDELPTILCDRLRLAQVFRNLITNAIKYNDKKETKFIHIGCNTTQEPYVFYVRDNGIGIPDNLQSKIFKIFKRLHNQNDYGGGTGAGLTIVKKIVEQHDGEIWLESEENSGTTFFFTLAPQATI